MATIPPPDTIPETPPLTPGGIPDEINMPGPDVDVPDPVDPNDPAGNPGFA